MGFFSKMWEGIKSIGLKALDIVKKVPGLGETIMNGVSKFLSIAIPPLGIILQTIEAISMLNGILKAGESVAEIGDKAMKSDKKPEDFESTKEYINYLRNNVKSSKEELEKLSPEEQLARNAVGGAILTKAIEEKKGVEIPFEFWQTMMKSSLSAKEIDEFLTKFKETKIAVNDFMNYLEGKISPEKEEKIDNVLVEAYKELKPELSTKEIEEEVVRLRQNG